MSTSNTPLIVQVSAILDPRFGGPHRVVEATSLHLQKRANFHLLVFGTCNLLSPKIITDTTFKNNRYGFRFRGPSRKSREILQTADILIIHGFYLASTLYALYFSSTHRVFLMPHGSLESYQEKHGKIRKYLFKFAVTRLLRKRYLHFLLASNAEIGPVKQSFPKFPVSVVGLGVDQTIFLATKRVFNRDKIVLGCISRITQKKRIDLCIKATSDLIKRGFNVKLKIYGHGDPALEQELRSIANQLGVSNQVNFEGFVDNEKRMAAFHEIDILLLSSENENFAISVAESIVAGKPVIVSKYVAMQELVEIHQTGHVIGSLTISEISNAVISVAEKYSVYQQNCISAAHIFDWEYIMDNWFNILFPVPKV